jgi:drug/metabolite transporter, DME family
VTQRHGGPPWGAVAVLAAAVLWGSIGVLSVGLFRLGLSPWEVAFWRAALSAAVLGGGVLLARPSLLRLERTSDALLLGAFGVVGVGLFYVSYQLALALTSVAVAVVLLYTAPVWVVLGAALLLGERLGGRKLLMLGVVVVGVWATALGAVNAEVRVTVVGVGWGLLAALSYASYYLFGKRYLPRFGVVRMLLFSLLAGTLVLAVAAAAAGHPPRLDMPAGAWPLLAALAFGTTLLANGLYYWGLSRIEAGRAAILASVEPVTAALLALTIFGEALSPLGWIGVVIVTLGVATVPAGRRGAEPNREAEAARRSPSGAEANSLRSDAADL